MNHMCSGTACLICYPAAACQCPAAWWGIYPPYCPVHNPGWTSPHITITQSATSAPGLSPEDIEKIARRVAELLRGG